MMTMIYTSHRKFSMYRILVSITLYTWTVLAFPNQFQLTTTTSARSLAIPLPSSVRGRKRRSGHPTFLQQAILDKIKSGGETKSSLSSSVDATHEENIHKFLSSQSRNYESSLLEQFQIQGWRWHTKSLARDAGRLQKLASKTELKSTKILKDACDFVVGFNMVGLHKIEATLFFPWMREKLTGGTRDKPELSAGFASAMDALERDRKEVVSLGEKISEKALLACDTNELESRRTEAIADIANGSKELKNIVQRMMLVEDTLLVPAIGAIVPIREQKSFNNKVLRRLGLLDSRLHLVGMYETVWEDGDSKEKELFKQAIPGITRQIIPRWKRKLYEPKTYMME
jgi:hypothetical protein